MNDFSRDVVVKKKWVEAIRSGWTAQGRINQVANVSIETGLPRKVYIVILGASLRLPLAKLRVKVKRLKKVNCV